MRPIHAGTIRVRPAQASRAVQGWLVIVKEAVGEEAMLT